MYSGVCAYVHACVCVSVCVHACVCTCVRVCGMCARVRKYVHGRVFACVHACVWCVRACVRARADASVHARALACGGRVHVAYRNVERYVSYRPTSAYRNSPIDFVRVVDGLCHTQHTTRQYCALENRSSI